MKTSPLQVKKGLKAKTGLRKRGKSPISKIKEKIQHELTRIARIKYINCIFKDKGVGNCSGYTAADHIITRARTLTYGMIINVILACSFHHIWWKPSHPTEYTEIVKKVIGIRIYNQLQKLGKKTTQYKLKDWEKILEELKNTL